MILRELNKRIVVFITLCFFLMSTSGMVLFYHFCQHSNKTLVSLYIDTTQKLCEQSINNCSNTIHSHKKLCCYSQKENANHNHHQHKSNYKTVKIHTVYSSTNQQTLPKPISLLVLSFSIPLETSITINNKGVFRELPMEIPILLPSGREIITSNHSLKIHC